MLQIYNIKDKQNYLEEVAKLTILEWGNPPKSNEQLQLRINKKVAKIKENFDNPRYCKLILLDDEILIGFISIFPTDGNERCDLSPWYATMYVKKEYRRKGYSKLLNKAILNEAKSRCFEKIYLKSDLVNYYEKFGAKYIEDLKSGDKLYYIKL